MTIEPWRKFATNELKAAGIPSATLDADLILAHTIEKTRTWILAHTDADIDPSDQEKADELLERRKLREPLAYLTGHREFYGREFLVSPNTLIPRPESETAIELLHDLPQPLSGTLVDVGAGSGALGITAALEFPSLRSVTLADTSEKALAVADQNKDKLLAPQHTVMTIRSDLMSSFARPFTYILANLPYVDRTWERSPETDYEPEEALFASDQGLELIFRLIRQTADKLERQGYLLLEADPSQFPSIKDFAANHSLSLVREKGFIILFQKV